VPTVTLHRVPLPPQGPFIVKLEKTWRKLATWALLTTALCGIAPRAHAQTCHPIDVRLHDGWRYRVVLGVSSASYGSGNERADYQGLHTGFSYRLTWFGIDALVPAYRLTRLGGTQYGVGDIVLSARGTVLSLLGGRLTSGLEVAVMVPTGNAEKGLGMGRAMSMPGSWLTLTQGLVLFRAQLGYAVMHGQRATQDSHHAASSAPHPIVNPMNQSELQHALTVALSLASNLSVHLRWFGALPVADEFGSPRQIVAGGGEIGLGALDLSAELQLPVVGDPFRCKLALQLGANF